MQQQVHKRQIEVAPMITYRDMIVNPPGKDLFAGGASGASTLFARLTVLSK